MPIQINIDEMPDMGGPLPFQPYKVIIRKVTQEPSSKTSAAQDVLECDILSPEKVECQGAESVAAGRDFKLYITYSQKNLKRAQATLAKLGFRVSSVAVPTEDEVQSRAETRIPEIQDVTSTWVGLTFGIRLKTEPMYKTDTGKWDGQKIRDEHGNFIVMGHKIAMPNGDDIVSALEDSDGKPAN